MALTAVQWCSENRKTWLFKSFEKSQFERQQVVVTLFHIPLVGSSVLTLECDRHIVSPRLLISNMAFISALNSQAARARHFEISEMKLKV